MSPPWKTPLDWRDAGSARLDDPAGLEAMLRTWRANLAQMAERARARGWTCEGPEHDPGLKPPDLQRLGRTLGVPFPAQLGWALMQMSEWRFGWQVSPRDEPRGDLSSCSAGGVRGAVWSAHALAALQDELQAWLPWQDDEADEEGPAEALTAFWRQHLPFLSLPNGDMLTLDLRHADPGRQPVRYFSHEQDGLHGGALAPDFFSFISRWTALGCVGSEWWSWEPFVVRRGPEQPELDPAGPQARRWIDWLDKVPAHLGGQPSTDEAPALILARSAADAALLAAAAANDLDGVRRALREGAHPDCTDGSEWSLAKQTAVMHAARHGHLAMLDLLLAAGASLATHALPLAEVMHDAPVPALKWLLAHGARIDPWEGDRFNALHHLYDRDLPEEAYFELLDAMLAAGCNPDVFHDTQSSHARTTLLMRCGAPTARKLLDAGADPWIRDLDGRTAMHHVSDLAHVQLLAARGLSVNDLATPEAAEDAEHATRPLHFNLSLWSVEAPVECVDALLEAGADPALPDAQGRNAWWYCRHRACAELLARRLPFDPAWRDARGGSPLHHLLTQAGRIDTHAMDLVRYWCEQGLDVNARDLQGDTALHLMARQYDSIHHRPSIECLLALGADWELPNRQGRTARQSLKKKHQAAWR